MRYRIYKHITIGTENKYENNPINDDYKKRKENNYSIYKIN